MPACECPGPHEEGIGGSRPAPWCSDGRGALAAACVDREPHSAPWHRGVLSTRSAFRPRGLKSLAGAFSFIFCSDADMSPARETPEAALISAAPRQRK